VWHRSIVAHMSATPDRPLDDLQLRYQRVQQALAEEIQRGGRTPGARLPPERALAEHFGVSRVTLRRALDELARSGIVTRTGSGWQVASGAMSEPPNELMSFSEMAAARGLSAGSREISRSVRAASIDEAETLGLAPGADLFELVRLRSMDEVPMLIATSLIPLSLVPEIQKMVPPGGSLYSVLEESFGLRPARARITVEAVPAGSKEAKLLGLNQGEPLLYCHQLTEDETGRTIEICEMRYRGDRYRFRASLVRAGALETRAPLEPAAVQGQV
jgi:GntR family transcriptional regulator